ncbi:MAG: DUF3047 domain-containing protein [Sporichthyaceae bacterium]
MNPTEATIDVPADSPGWIDTGIAVEAGQFVTLFATGTAGPAGGPDDLTFRPELFLCYRVSPTGAFDKLAAATTTFVADSSGTLELVANFPGAWLDRRGELDDVAWPRPAAAGTYTVRVLVWDDDPVDGLAPQVHSDPLAAAERRRLLQPSRLPDGWRPVWRVGATEAYRDHSGPTGSWIGCRCENDGGLIVAPVDVPLTDATRLRWDWRVLALPSAVAEDTLLTHDYLSIAVEFDNGFDLTYLWSSALPVGTSFACPLPWWSAHETHQVVRSGTADLGRWTSEEQPVLADYARAIGGPPPQRIVGVWLIAVAVFQGGLGECEYRGIDLVG